MSEETGFSEAELEYIRELANITAKVEVKKQMSIMLISSVALSILTIIIVFLITRGRLK